MKRTTGVCGRKLKRGASPRQCAPDCILRQHSGAHKSKRYINQEMLDTSHRDSRGVLCIPSATGVETLRRCRVRLDMISSSSVIHEHGSREQNAPKVQEMASVPFVRGGAPSVVCRGPSSSPPTSQCCSERAVRDEARLRTGHGRVRGTTYLALALGPFRRVQEGPRRCKHGG